MKKALVLSLAVTLLAAPVLAGVVKKTKSDVSFKGFGKFTTTQSEKLTAEQKWTNSLGEFKGEGLAGKLVGKAMMRAGDTGEIIDLSASTITQLDNKKKEYTVSPIKKLSEEMGGKPEAAEKPSEKETESHIKVTKNEFKVQDTGEQSTINNFPVHKYLVLWLMEWENTQTGEKGSNQLDSTVWTTPLTDTIKQSQAEELKFSQAYMQKLGINMSQLQQDVLGTSWMSMLDAFGKPQARPKRENSQAAAEMQKIKGYPIVIDGKYMVTGQKPTAAAGETAEQQPQETPKSVGGALGGFLKKTIKKKPAEPTATANEPALSFHTEVLEISTPSLGSGDFQVPAGYKKKD
jgi:hypothetical protein